MRRRRSERCAGSRRQRPPRDGARTHRPSVTAVRRQSERRVRQSKCDRRLLVSQRLRTANASAKRAVIVWFPGGGLVGGSSTDYDASGLVKTGNVIVVSVNYRVGALGFFAYPRSTRKGTKRATMAYGSAVRAAVVQRNIGAFGGDPANVTIAGESAGALTVLAHMVAPESAHLFARAIMESSGTPPVTARGVPRSTSPKQREQDLPPLPDARTWRVCAPSRRQSGGCAVGVSLRLIGGPNTPIPVIFHAAFTAGTYNHVPVLTGTNHNEWRWSVANAELNSGSRSPPTGIPQRSRPSTERRWRRRS